MPRLIDPTTWDHFLGFLRRGYSLEGSARLAGVSRGAARTFLNGNSASARRWRELTAGPCPLCGCEQLHGADPPDH